MEKIAIHWMRRDLRLEDNAALHHALNGPFKVLPLFIFDTDILEKLQDKTDARVGFLHQTLSELQSRLGEMGSSLLVKRGKPEEVWKSLMDEFNIQAVYTNRDYEPYAVARDQAVRNILQTRGINFHTFKDHVIFEGAEVVKDDGKPYTVFTPYSRKWKKVLAEGGNGITEASIYLKPFPVEPYLKNLLQTSPKPIPTLAQLGFEPSQVAIPPSTVSQGIIRRYDQDRDFPAKEGTSRLGIHFRFGTISIREKARNALTLNDTYLNELIWRDFYSMILQHFPHVAQGAFRKEYEQVPWRNNPDEFKAWCEGRTGYPIVDAGMRELNNTGHMHNRVRMIVASFLTKHLLIDWRWGEAYFASKLLDFDLASNNGGWQWAAGCGTDAAPYFRIFNPTSQQQKFDPRGEYVSRWVPEWKTERYVKPIVVHELARERCLAAYKTGLKG